MSDRDAFREAREHGLAKRQERRLTSDPVKALRYLLAQYDRVVEIHDQVVMDTPEDRELHDRAIATFREAVEPIRNAMDTYPTTAEVKVLTETASKVAYELGRKDAGEEIAAAIDDERDPDFPTMVNRNLFIQRIAKMARETTSQPAQATSDAISGVPRHSEVSEAPKAPQEPCEDCGLTDDHKGGGPQTGEAPRPGAPG